MNAHALTVLEFPRVLDVVAGHASSDLGAARIRALTPRVDREWLDREHGRVAALGSALDGDSPWHPEPIPDLGEALERIRIEGIAWSTQEFLGAGILLRSSRLGSRSRSVMRPRGPPILRGVLAPQVVEPSRWQFLPSEQEIGRVIHDDATRSGRRVGGAEAHSTRAPRVARRLDATPGAGPVSPGPEPSRRRHLDHGAQRSLRDPGAARRA